MNGRLRPRDLFELCLLAALWGASFLFMRMGAAEFGPVALAGLRVIGATLCLAPFVVASGAAGALRQRWRAIAVVGLLNSALPFLLYSYAALSISAGLSSIFNATTPLWGALIAWLWLGTRLGRARVLGLAIGFAGVLWLAWDKAGFRPGAEGSATGYAVLACLAATFFYGLAAHYAQRRLAGVPPLAVAAGSQLAASVVLAVPTLLWWPAQSPSAHSWFAVAGLAFACTGLAYLLYFRLIARIGPANAVAVTFLIPAFAVLWGALFLAERLTGPMVIGCGVIVLGTALATGLLATRPVKPADPAR